MRIQDTVLGFIIYTLVFIRGLEDFLVLRTMKHDKSAFTQGLVNYAGCIYESAGLYGRSSLRKLDEKTLRVLKKVNLPAQYFAEGITIINDRIYMLTYHEKIMLVFSTDLELLQRVGYQTYTGEGWGLTNDGEFLIASDGSSKLTIYEVPALSMTKADKLKKVREITVRDKASGRPIKNVNELEYVGGYIYANVWFQDYIIKIDSTSGVVAETFDLKSLYPEHHRAPQDDVFNGLAFNSTDNTFLVTGKHWPNYYHVQLKDTMQGRP